MSDVRGVLSGPVALVVRICAQVLRMPDAWLPTRRLVTTATALGVATHADVRFGHRSMGEALRMSQNPGRATFPPTPVALFASCEADN